MYCMTFDAASFMDHSVTYGFFCWVPFSVTDLLLRQCCCWCPETLRLYQIVCQIRLYRKRSGRFGETTVSNRHRRLLLETRGHLMMPMWVVAVNLVAVVGIEIAYYYSTTDSYHKPTLFFDVLQTPGITVDCSKIFKTQVSESLSLITLTAL